MASIERIRVAWTGFPGGPGISTFYALSGATAVAPISAFFQVLKTWLPIDIHTQVQSSGDVLESSTGALTGSWVGSGGGFAANDGQGPYSAASGLTIRWDTGGIFSGRRLRGRTYIVPLVGSAFDTDGTPNSGVVASINVAAAALIAAVPGNLVVWQRPRPASLAWTDVHGRLHPAKTLRTGGEGSIILGTVVDKAAVLTSRRD